MLQVNNAAVASRPGDSSVKLCDLPVEDAAKRFSYIYETNVFAVITVTNAFLPLLQAAPAARIVVVSSTLGSLEKDMIIQEYAAYSSSKTALNAVTRHYAKDLADSRVKINLACPGYCGTDLNNFAGPRTPAQGAEIMVKLATLPDDGPHGGYFDDNGRIPW